MNKRLKWGIVPTILGLVLSAKLSAQTFVDFEAVGSGGVETNCKHIVQPGCTARGTGLVGGTPITAASSIELRTDTGSPTSTNGPALGICVPASGAGLITETGGSTLSFNTAGTLCEEDAPSTPYHFKGSYRITGGTGRFANATGAGNVTAAYGREGTFTRGGGNAVFFIRGSISY